MSDELELWEIVRCPESRARLTPVTAKWVTRLNARIEAGELRTSSGELVSEPIQDGLITDNDRYLYPIRDGVPNLVIAHRIVLKDD